MALEMTGSEGGSVDESVGEEDDMEWTKSGQKRQGKTKRQ